MKLSKLSLIGFLLALAPLASAAVVTFTSTDQNVTLTGIGPNVSGQGQSAVTWGTCAFDGANTNCLLSGSYTGMGGGTFRFVLSYPGNGPTPLTFISNTPGSDLIFANLTSGSILMTLAGNNGTTATFYDPIFTMFFTTAATCTGVSPCAVGKVGLAPASTITGVVSGTFDPTPTIKTGGVITATDFGGFSAIASGTWIEIYGTNLGTTLLQVWGQADFKGDQAPTNLAGTTVTIGGKPAFVDFVSPHQVNAQVPSGLAAMSQPVIVTTAGGASTGTPVTANATEPGLLATIALKVAAGQYVIAQSSDGLTYVLPPGLVPGFPAVRAKPGNVIVLYGVGFGSVTPDTPAGQIIRQTSPIVGNLQITFAGTPAAVSYAGLVPGYVGLYQFNVTVPNVAASDTVPLKFTLNGVAGPQSLIIPIQN